MKKIPQLFASVLVIPVMLMSTTLPAPSIGISAIDNTVSEIGQKAFSQIGKCLGQPDAELNALFVLDASSSLSEDTDVDGVRGNILAQSIAQLVSVTESRPVNIAISSFDLDYIERVPWEPLNEESFERINQDIPSWVSTWWGSGGGTDWEDALSGGAETMRDSPNASQACKIIIWLTDGGINVDGPREIAPNKAAMENICGTNPVNGDQVMNGDRVANDSIVAQLRSEKVHLIGVLLESEDYLDGLADRPDELANEKSRFSYMLPVTEGIGVVNNAAFVNSGAEDFEYSCGNIPIPEGQALGALLSGSSPIALAFAFSDLDNGIRGGTREDLGTDFPVDFDIEPGINSLTVQLAGSSWSLTGPEGLVIQSGAENLDGVSISEEGDLANIRIVGAALPPGEWTLDVEEPLASAVIYRGLEVDGTLVAINPELKAGETSEIAVEFRDAFTDQVVPNGLYSTGTLDLTLTEGQSSPQNLTCVQDSSVLKFTCTVKPVQVGEAIIDASFDLETQSGSIRYTYTGSFVQDVLPSAAFPSVTPTSVQLSEIAGKDGRASGTVTLNGPAQGSGEVCLPTGEDLSVVSDVIDRGDSFSLEWLGVTGNCVPLEQGETVEAQLSIGTSVAASGQASVSLPFVLKSSDSANELKQDVIATFTTVRKGTPNPFVFLGLLIIGFGIPIALLYMQARSASRLSLKGLQVANVPVRITTAGDVVRLTRATPGINELFQVDDWQWFSSSVDKTRSFITPSGAKLIAKTPKNPLGSLSAFAVAPEGSRVITSEGSATDGLSGKIGLSPANQWILTVPTSELLGDSDELNGQLVAFANPNGGALEEVNRQLSLSAQDGMLLGSLLTVRNNLLAQPAKGKPVKEKKVKKSKESESSPSSPATQEPQQSADSTQASPFDALFGGTGNTGGTGTQGNPSSPSPSTPPPPPKAPGSGMNNPFENL